MEQTKTKRKKPEFVERESKFSAKIKKRWRFPRGMHSAVRQRHKGRISMPSPGYGAPSQVRGLHPTGLRERLVFKISDLNDLNPKNEGAVISRRIGARKKLDILRKAQEMNLKIISVKDPSNLEKKIVTQLEERKKQRSKRIEQKEKKLEDKKKAQEKSKSEEKESMKPDDQKTGVEEKIVQEEEKQKIEKEIAHKVITKKTAK